MKTIKIHGRDYVTVAERLKEFRKKYPNLSIESTPTHLTDEAVTFHAVIKNEEGRVISDGWAHKEKSWGGVHTRNMIEFCQTSAIGRALAYFGIGVTDDIASAEEMETDSSGEASYQQMSLIEELLPRVSIPEKHRSSIEAELTTMTSARASRCITYLKENVVEDNLNDQFDNKINDPKS